MSDIHISMSHTFSEMHQQNERKSTRILMMCLYFLSCYILCFSPSVTTVSVKETLMRVARSKGENVSLYETLSDSLT